MTIGEIYEKAPKSERTLMRHKYKWLGCQFKNDLGYACEYRVIYQGEDLGMIKYYGGRLLCAYKLRKKGE